jgi:hypothetical protein
MSRLKLDLAELQAESIHHLTGQFSEFDITNYERLFGLHIQISKVKEKETGSLLTLLFPP